VDDAGRRRGGEAALGACGVFLTYLLASVLLTWPLALHPSSLLFGDFGDTRGGVWWLWAKLGGWLDGAVNPLVAAPFGVRANPGFAQPLSEWYLSALAAVGGEVVAFNLYVLLAFPLTALATYLFLDALLKDRLAAFFGGLVFGFCPAAVMQSAGGHAGFAFNPFIPLLAWSLVSHRERRSNASALRVAACLAAITLSILYFGYFALFIVAFFFAGDVFAGRGARRAIVVSYVKIGLIFALLVLPFEYQAVMRQFSAAAEELASAGRIRSLHELTIFSARPLEYLVPPLPNPVLGPFAAPFVAGSLVRTNLFEQTLYLGLVPLGLVALGLLWWCAGGFAPSRARWYAVFTCAAVYMFFLSLPPVMDFGAARVPTLSLFAYDVAPMFRVYARAGILVAFFVAAACAVVLAELRARRPARGALVAALLFGLLAIEYWTVPPDYARDVSHPPAVYRWLAGEPGDFIVAEYPMFLADEAAAYDYPFWQRVHGKRLANGASPDMPDAWRAYRIARRLDDPRTPALLRSLGVRYVIVHRGLYRQGNIPDALKPYYPAARSGAPVGDGRPPLVPPELREERAFGEDIVFTLEASGATVPGARSVELERGADGTFLPAQPFSLDSYAMLDAASLGEGRGVELSVAAEATAGARSVRIGDPAVFGDMLVADSDFSQVQLRPKGWAYVAARWLGWEGDSDWRETRAGDALIVQRAFATRDLRASRWLVVEFETTAATRVGINTRVKGASPFSSVVPVYLDTLDHAGRRRLVVDTWAMLPDARDKSAELSLREVVMHFRTIGARDAAPVRLLRFQLYRGAADGIVLAHAGAASAWLDVAEALRRAGSELDSARVVSARLILAPGASDPRRTIRMQSPYRVGVGTPGSDVQAVPVAAGAPDKGGTGIQWQWLFVAAIIALIARVAASRKRAGATGPMPYALACAMALAAWAFAAALGFGALAQAVAAIAYYLGVVAVVAFFPDTAPARVREPRSTAE
jgi:hypothetical protein